MLGYAILYTNPFTVHIWEIECTYKHSGVHYPKPLNSNKYIQFFSMFVDGIILSIQLEFSAHER